MIKILDAEKRYMFPDEGLMKEWYDEFNRRFFDAKLERIGLKVGYLQKRTHGQFYSPDQDSHPGFHPVMCTITLNCRYFNSEDEWRTVFLHEMVHFAAYKQTEGRDFGHGKTFKRIAKRINETSEFKIETYYHGRVFRPRWEDVRDWEKQRCRDFIIGSFSKKSFEDYVDEDTNEVFNIDICTPVATFKTTRAFLPEIIDNLSSVRGKIKWFEVTACCQRLALIRNVRYTPDFNNECLCNNSWYEEDIEDGIMAAEEDSPVKEFGPIECSLLGTTQFEDGKAEGYGVAPLQSSFRQKYFQDAGEIGKLAAERLVDVYRETPRWYETTHHATLSVTPPGGGYTIEVDSRFIALAAMTPKKIQINPIWSDTMMESVRKGDSEALASEITRVILCRRRG